MSNALNDICFVQPHWQLIAKGISPEEWFNEHNIISSGGINNPTRVHLNQGHRYYRFFSNPSKPEKVLDGGWWLSFDTINTIWHYSIRMELQFTYAARLFLALPYDWTRVDRIVSAILTSPLDAYAGEGNVAKTITEKWTPVQNIKVTQLYIPGLYVKRDVRNESMPQLYESVWKDVRYEYANNRAPL
ncbi:hypothetical protein RO575_20445 [Methylomonas sp. MO1]|uniref:hypothetical protein n=1 Tax=Methylomonas sp. MO1 TaxID=3073619 RepID=UPI0028A47EB2|nr:hypothetical protein [Methylomonas sp. MO1]MDT4291941.1 hypothetical protein [Methylomonas sp. MO1]